MHEDNGSLHPDAGEVKIVAVGAILGGYTSGMRTQPEQVVKIADAAWAEGALKHDMFWATQYEMDEDETSMGSCAEWADISWAPEDSHECFLVCDKLHMYWDRTKDLRPKPLKDHTTVMIGPVALKHVATRVQAGNIEHKHTFDKGLGGLPLPVAGGGVCIKLKDDAVPQRCPEPKWGYGPKRTILEKWAREKLASGEFEPAPQSEW
jgi:hypothetical protein